MLCQKILSNCNKKNLSNHNKTNSSLRSEIQNSKFKLKMSSERINRSRVVEKSYDEKGQIFILRLKGQELVVTLTKDLIKSLHTNKNDAYGFTRFMDFENEMVNGCKVVNKLYVENGSSFILNLNGQVEPVAISKDLVKSLHAMTVPTVDQLQDSIESEFIKKK
jgi:hypothetical protein